MQTRLDQRPPGLDRTREVLGAERAFGAQRVHRGVGVIAVPGLDRVLPLVQLMCVHVCGRYRRPNAERVGRRYFGTVPSFHHVNLGVPEGGVDAESAFLVDVLGYRPLDPGPDLKARGAIWFDTDDDTQVHLSVDPKHHPSERAHTALVFGDELPEVELRLTKAAIEFNTFELDGRRILFCCDPAGNRWELRSS
jgi:catechol 2,3-dioxygenase-like lactoylglutathione lyase family enzyme